MLLELQAAVDEEDIHCAEVAKHVVAGLDMSCTKKACKRLAKLGEQDAQGVVEVLLRRLHRLQVARLKT